MKRALSLFLLSSAFVANGQILVSTTAPGGAIRLLNTDQAVLEAGEPRQDLPCSVTDVKPLLGFDMRFHAGYEVTLPLREVAGAENLLTILFRVTPLEATDSKPLYFTQRLKVPVIEQDAKGDTYIQGGFDVGEGKYKVDWLMRDRMERVCASTWEVQSELPAKDKQLNLELARGEIRASDREQFKDEPPVQRVADDKPLNVKVLVNFAPQNANAATLQPIDTTALTAILRNISREPRIGKFTLVAFNLHEQRVVYRQDNAEKIDFPGLGEALDTINLATVDLRRLGEKNGEAEFLSKLIQEEIGSSASPSDAVVFAGPKALIDQSVPTDSLKEIGNVDYPIFYMNYNLYPQSVPWNDAIGKAVKFLKGYEYTISKPRDLWFAVTEMVSRIVKTKQDRRSGTSSSE